MKKLIVTLLCAVLVLSMAACGSKPAETTSPVTEAQETRPEGPVGGRPAGPIGGNVQIANPYIPCETMEEAAAIAGFSMTIPEEKPEWAQEFILQAVENRMIEVIYAETGNFAEGEKEIRLRKAPGEEDIGGVYDGYKDEQTVTVGQRSVTMSGEDGKVMIATWYENGYTYFIRAAQGLTQDEMVQWVQAIA